MKLSGQCHCGSIKFEIEDKNFVRSDCDCRDCQRATGSLKTPFVSVKPELFVFLAGTGKEFKADSGTSCDLYGRWLFCEKCGTTLMWMADDRRHYDILAGIFNEVDVVSQLPQRA